MSVEALRDAEVMKLARVLDAHPEALEGLAPLDAAEVRALRELLTQRLFDEHADLFRRLARSSRLLPAAIMAKLSEHVFGPLISARTAGLMPVDKAVGVAEKLSIDFQAELSLQLDPRSAPDLLRAMPVELVVETARVLSNRREFITMARFVDALTDEAIQAVVGELQDNEALVRIGFYVESSDALSRVIELLPSDRLRATVLMTTDGAHELRQAGLVMLSTVHDPVKGLMLDAISFHGEGLLRRLVGNVEREGAEAVLDAAAAACSPETRAAVHRITGRHA